MDSYRVLEGETLYDVAAKLYSGDTFLGISDLLENNSISLDSLLPATLSYNAGISRTVSKKTSLVPIVLGDQVFYSWQGQTHYDLAIQLYGSIDGLLNIIQAVPSLDTDIATRTAISYKQVSNKNSKFFLKRIVATGLTGVAQQGILMEDGTSFILQEDGSTILLE